MIYFIIAGILLQLGIYLKTKEIERNIREMLKEKK